MDAAAAGGGDEERACGALSAPALLIHGDRDETVPVEVSDAYAEAEPDEDHFTMTGSYSRGLPPLHGRMAKPGSGR